MVVQAPVIPPSGSCSLLVNGDLPEEKPDGGGDPVGDDSHPQHAIADPLGEACADLSSNQ